jgi:hypothetical protein
VTSVDVVEDGGDFHGNFTKSIREPIVIGLVGGVWQTTCC